MSRTYYDDLNNKQGPVQNHNCIIMSQWVGMCDHVIYGYTKDSEGNTDIFMVDHISKRPDGRLSRLLSGLYGQWAFIKVL